MLLLSLEMLLSRTAVKKFLRFFCCDFYTLLLIAYLFLLQYCRASSYDDPTSYFFNPTKAFAPGYSAQRQEEASSFLGNSSNLPFKRIVNTETPKLCIGIATVARENVSYLHLSTGSLLHGLTHEERQQIELKVLFAHSDPGKHPNWNSPILASIVDEMLDYGDSFSSQKYIQELEGDTKNESSKTLFDYSYLLQACRSSGADYVFMLEDDTVVAKGWYRRVVEGLESVRDKLTKLGYSSDDCQSFTLNPKMLVFKRD